MPHCVGAFVDIKMRSEVHFAASKLVEEAVNVAIHLWSHSVDLHPIAGRQQDHFGQVAAQLETAPAAAQPGRGHRQLLAHFDRRGFIAQSSNEESPSVALWGGLNGESPNPGTADPVKSCDLTD